MREASDYLAVKKYPFFEGYVERFSRTSIDNDIPAMLSFFYIQGQIAAPFIRIPWDASHLDPRVHVFWIQPSRTGKSVAWEFVGDVLKDCGLQQDMYTSGSDAGLIGGVTNETVVDENGKKEQVAVQTEGMLAGQKALNFDEGSIILNPGKHSQETVLYLQSACNPIGSNSNILVKHLSGRRIETESLVSLWITTYPPAGVKEYVLTKGIFQRVLLYWSDWDMDRRMGVSMKRMERAFTKTPKQKLSYDEIIDYFTGLQKRLRDRVLNLTEISFAEWDGMSREEQEDSVQSVMHEMFAADDSFYVATYDLVEDLYSLLDGLNFAIGNVVASFIPAMENYSVILATHIAMMDESWVITGEHLDMAKEIIYDLFKNLILWLEGEVEVGAKQNEKANHAKNWNTAYNLIAPVELDKKGEGWRKKAAVIKQYCITEQVTRGTAFSRFSKWGAHLFDAAKDGATVYIRLKEVTA
ncbi:MAG: hypothetical protein CMI60_03030 [Parvibaculum sp.]|nr:hypothetical protein [Parvibaculum sp.]